MQTSKDNIINVTINEKEIKVELKDKDNKNRALWGTTRALINNAVQGVSVGFEKEMEIVGKNSPLISKFIIKKTSQFYNILRYIGICLSTILNFLTFKLKIIMVH